MIDISRLKDWLQESAQTGYRTLSQGLTVAGAGAGYVVTWVGSLRLFGSTATTTSDSKVDQRHYFLVPDLASQDGYSLCVTRCLPEGVPPINDLPKQRLLHLPNQDSEAMLRSLLIRQARVEELSKPATNKSWGDHASQVADAIDKMDQKAFGGVLLIGSLVAIFNPIAGAAIAAKALVPSLGLWASTYGLRVVGDKLNQAELERRVKLAETEVINQFRGSDTRQVINPILSILDRAIRTTEEEFDPLMELHELLGTELSDSDRHSISLASAAVLDVCDSATNSRQQAALAGLGPEDVRFIELLKSFGS